MSNDTAKMIAKSPEQHAKHPQLWAQAARQALQTAFDSRLK